MTWNIIRTIVIASVAAVVGSLGCGNGAMPTSNLTACTDADAFEFKYIDHFESIGASPLWSAGDSTPGGSASASILTIPDGPHCGSDASLVLRASGNEEWGALFGFNQLGPQDASAYEGVSFWARALGKSRTVTIFLDDPNTSTNGIGNCQQSMPTCVQVNPSTGACESLATTPQPNECGNSYTAEATVTGEWQLLTIPFGKFQQANWPNRVPNAILTQTGSAPGTALLTSSLLGLTFRAAKKTDLELWIDDIGFYKKKD